MAGVVKIDKGIIVPKVLNLLFAVLIKHRLTFLYFAISVMQSPSWIHFKTSNLAKSPLFVAFVILLDTSFITN